LGDVPSIFPAIDQAKLLMPIALPVEKTNLFSCPFVKDISNKIAIKKSPAYFITTTKPEKGFKAISFYKR
jgi:hypothetical protein